MLTVTDKAAQHLRENLSREEGSPPGAFRIVNSEEGYQLTLDEAKEGDQVFEHEGESVLFIDTAGIRRRGRIEGGVERYSVMRSLRAISRADVAVLLTEAADIITAQDAHIAG